MKRKFNFLPAILLTLTFAITAFNPVSNQKNPAAWMQNTRYGVMVHYLEQLQDAKNPWYQGKRTSWDQCVNDFNVNTFAQTMHDIGAGYVIFSVYQASRYMCVPNETYEQMTGYKRGDATPNRDLIADLYDALNKYNIKLMLYVTGDGTYADSNANKIFKNPMLQWKQNGNKFIATDDYVDNWAKVLRDISMRYGSKISGWWVDGAYPFHGYNDTLLHKLHAALKAGNPNTIIAFNPAPHLKVIKQTKWEEYTGGEMYKLADTPPKGGMIDGVQWHEMTFLGNNWKEPGVRFNADSLVDYVNTVNGNGGVITFDVCTLRDGNIDPTQYAFMKQISQRIQAR